MRLKTILALFFAILIIVFSLQNAEVTDVKFLFWKMSMSQVLIILGSFIIGFLVGILVAMKKRLIGGDSL